MSGNAVYLECEAAGEALITMDEVRQAAQKRFTDRGTVQAEGLDTVVQLLQSRGLVHRLDPRQATWVLLKPERINQYGASIIQATSTTRRWDCGRAGTC